MPNKHIPPIHFSPQDFHRVLLTWYDAARRDLPWRARPGEKPDPYRVWLSEIMLQQTTVKAVIPYFETFVTRWPTAKALGAASRDEVLAAWAGLGYYSRARNLHACAQALARDGFPRTEAGLRALPGIGAYTAAAIAAIAFDAPAAAVDGNVERVLSRVFALDTPLPSAKPALRALAASLTPQERSGDYAQAMMDLGATICSPRTPSCLVCPVRDFCIAAARGEAERFPVKLAKAARPLRRGDAFVILRKLEGDWQILLRRRKDKGLLGGMMEVPCTEWTTDASLDDAGRHKDRHARERACEENRPTPKTVMAAPDPAIHGHPRTALFLDGPVKPGHDGRGVREIPASLPRGNGRNAVNAAGEFGVWKQGRTVQHTFTHFHLELRVYAANGEANGPAHAFEGEWASLAQLSRYALPTVMKKAVAAGLKALSISTAY